MKTYLSLFLFFCNFSFGFGAELTTVMGRPSEIVARDLISINFDLVGDSKIDFSSTWAYSILYREGIKSTAAIEVLEDGSTSKELFLQGLKIAAQNTPVVFTNLGPLDDEICLFMAEQTDVAYVVVAGSSALPINLEDYPSCATRNILFVTTLNQDNGTLMSFANWGTLVRIASPGNSISVEDELGKEVIISGGTVASSLVAAKLAIFARENQDVVGAKLIGRFFETNTIALPALENLIEGSRALVH